MSKYFTILALQLVSFYGFCTTIKVSNIISLQAAEKTAKPGDVIILQNGIWNNVQIKLDCKGTENAVITFKAETAGKVMITGKSFLKIGGEYIVIDGLNFTNGYSTATTIIDFRKDKNNVANHCRVSNCLIDEFNKPQRMNEDYWVTLAGKHNRIDHCTFRNKKNMGVLMVVILDDEKSRENYHSIDNNYFDGRPPLGSNTGEMIRVGVSQHCTFNSNTIIADNYFKNCDGETEIISLKSCANIIKNNLFKECQGCVTLRHGNNNTVFNNIFLGNGKAGTGGVRIINEGNWVVNNFFYKCVGESFRSPLAVMNGVPNSPANRYLPVKDAVIANNSFIDCTPFSLCEGSDKERSQVPENVLIANNIFYNKKETKTFYQFDSINGFVFKNNFVAKSIKQDLPIGFSKTTFQEQLLGNINAVTNPTVSKENIYSSDIQKIAKDRIGLELSNSVGFSSLSLAIEAIGNTSTSTGILWKEEIKPIAKTLELQCANAKELIKALSDSIHHQQKINITLTGIIYELNAPIKIYNQVKIGTNDREIKFITNEQNTVFEIKGRAALQFSKANIDGTFIKAKHFVTAPSDSTCNHYNFKFINSTFSYFEGNHSSFFNATKSTIADSIIITNSTFENLIANIFTAAEEVDKKGYYNAEVIKINNNKFINNKGKIIEILRSGTDESTMGPRLWFNNNNINNTQSTQALVQLIGVQYSSIENNTFNNSNKETVIIDYKDFTRAVHIQSKNMMTNSGIINTNQFLINK